MFSNYKPQPSILVQQATFRQLSIEGSSCNFFQTLLAAENSELQTGTLHMGASDM